MISFNRDLFQYQQRIRHKLKKNCKINTVSYSGRHNRNISVIFQKIFQLFTAENISLCVRLITNNKIISTRILSLVYGCFQSLATPIIHSLICLQNYFYFFSENYFSSKYFVIYHGSTRNRTAGGTRNNFS